MTNGGLHLLWQWAHDNRGRARITSRGSNDTTTTTWLIAGPAADEPAADLEALAHRLNPGWVAHPPYRTIAATSALKEAKRR